MFLKGTQRRFFVGFFKTASTKGEDLFNLVKLEFRKMGLPFLNIVAECFDGASNMSGIHRGLVTRMKEVSPLGVYLHCYSHRLNLALKSTKGDLELLRSALGTIQGLYNFLEEGTKHHAVLERVQVEDMLDKTPLTLKCLSTTRWSCR